MTAADGRARWWTWAFVLALNLGLAAVAAWLAPGEATVSHTTDRAGYEYVGAHPLASSCPHSIYCYRMLVPVTLQALPGTPLDRWRGFAVVANALAGLTIAAAAARASSRCTTGPVNPDNSDLRSSDVTPQSRDAAIPVRVGASARESLVPMVLATILYQTSFGATFATFDPFTPDPAVFLGAALITLAWLREEPWLALAVGLVGVWAKETVALVGAIVAVGAVLTPRRIRADRRAWLISGAAPAVLVVLLHVVANRALGWSEAGSGSADLVHGAWLARWLADSTLTPATRAFYVFIPFGLAWLYAAVGISTAGPRLRALGIATLLLMPALVYVQTPERALANAFIVVVPLAVAFLRRVPWPLALLAVVSNGVLTARVGLASDALPAVTYGVVLAAIVGTLTLVWAFMFGRRSSSTAIGSSAPLASSR